MAFDWLWAKPLFREDLTVAEAQCALLRRAVSLGHRSAISIMLKRWNPERITILACLVRASSLGHLDLIKLLVPAIAVHDEVKQDDGGGGSLRRKEIVLQNDMLNRAVGNGHDTVVHWLLEEIEQSRLQCMPTAGTLLLAVESNRMELAKLLISSREKSKVDEGDSKAARFPFEASCPSSVYSGCRLDALQLLLPGQGLLHGAYVRLISQAVKAGRFDTFLWLCQRRHFWADALKIAASEGSVSSWI